MTAPRAASGGVVDTVDTVIVGASAAGLATAACLRRSGVPFVILERGDQIAPTWRNHYDRLHLHTSKQVSALPFVPFDRSVPRYPSRDQMVAYLENYARRFELTPRFRHQVLGIGRPGGDGAGWVTRVQVGAGSGPPAGTTIELRSRHVVVASGINRQPHRPQWPGMETFGGPILHSAEYRSARPFAGRDVLVVGIGNSGGEIALDLCEQGARASVVVRNRVNIVPRDFLGLPILYWSLVLSRLPTRLADAIGRVVVRLALGRLDRLGLRPLPYGSMAQIRRHGRYPLLDVGTVARVRRKEIEILPDVERFSPGRVHFRDGSQRVFHAVVLATGYRPALDTLLDSERAVLQGPDGLPPRSGAAVLPGLYFCGFSHPPTGLLREIGKEARRIARDIAADQPQAARLRASAPATERAAGV